MNTSLLNSLKRRWWLVLVLAIAGAGLGALPEPEKVEEQARAFQATHTLLLNDEESAQSTSTSISPNQVTLFVGTGEVSQRAAEVLGYTGNPATLASQVTSFFDFQTLALTISSTQDSASRAEDVANAFADELNAYLAERQDETYQNRRASAIERLTELEAELGGITLEVAADPDNPVLLAQQSAISRQYSVAFEQSQIPLRPPERPRPASHSALAELDLDAFWNEQSR